MGEKEGGVAMRVRLGLEDQEVWSGSSQATHSDDGSDESVTVSGN
jgi:hypothetical protein